MNNLLLPCEAQRLVPHRPPILIVEQLLERQGDRGVAMTHVPDKGIWVCDEFEVLPEYYIELIAQAAAAINGYDSLKKGKDPAHGFIAGVDDFLFHFEARPGEILWIELNKMFGLGPVDIVHGVVRNKSKIMAQGKIKVWKDNAETTL